jgi:tRNA pseudouridine55 synthase
VEDKNKASQQDRKTTSLDGAIILDKPQGITSHDTVVSARRILSEPRIGHLGTLDPFATGVLVLLVGGATRLARFYQDRDKAYEGLIRFGYSTSTFDSTGAPTSAPTVPALDEESMRRRFAELLGTHLQQPPAFSAKKISGTPAYRLARKGKEVQLAAVPVTIHELEVVSVESPCVRFRARVSSGTYLRSLAQELGERTGLGAHLAELRRTAVGEFAEDRAVSLPRLEERVRCGEPPVIALEKLLPELPAWTLSASEAKAALHGNNLRLPSEAAWLRLLDEAGRVRAIAGRVGAGLYHPGIVLPGMASEDRRESESLSSPPRSH